MIHEEKLYTHDTQTPQSTQIALLKKHFPNCFDKNGAFMPHKMAEVIGENELNLSKESYALNWLGKAYARVLAHDKPLTFLKADEVHNQHEANQNSENILIKGDNLEVLKHLRNAYAEQVKMIYIDPPYNTGSDGFVYNDDRKFTPEQLMRLAGIELEEAKRILEFTRSKANSHSAWLTFMYPRLYIARELLKDDGVIFISIDDNEQAQLKLLCDEVFGEENFVAQMSIITGANQSGKGVQIQKNIEICLVYCKSNIKLAINRVDKTNSVLRNLNDAPTPLDTREEMGYTIYYNEVTQDLIPLMDYDKTKISLNDESKVYSDNNELIRQGYIAIRPGMRNNKLHRWRWGLQTFIDRQNEIIIQKPNGIYNIYFMQDGFNPPKNIHSFGVGTIEVKKLFKEKQVFDYPKSTKFLKYLTSIGSSNNDLILDFFAGSGTTAHAVMDLNAKDGGKRKYICVQLPEPTDAKSEAHKAGYKTIFDITKARIEKAANHIRTTPSLLSHEIDLGFKIFETEPLFEGYDEEQETLEATTTLFDGSKLNAEALQTLLCTWKLYDGLSLTTPTQNVVLAGYNAYQAGKNLYAMHPGFDINAIKALIANLDDEADFNASKIVLFGYNVTSKTQRELFEALQSYTNKKSIELDVVVRY